MLEMLEILFKLQLFREIFILFNNFAIMLLVKYGVPEAKGNVVSFLMHEII